MSKILWVCGKHISGHDDGDVWDFQGVFDSEELAVKACRDDSYFVGEAALNESLPDESEEWPRAYYPLGKVDS